jgi:hypothetical protein
MPFAVNTKRESNFECRLVEWDLTLRYTVDEIIDRLKLGNTNGSQRKPERIRKTTAVYEAGRALSFDNGVVRALKLRGLYKKPLTDNRHDITCPWVNEHTDAVGFVGASSLERMAVENSLVDLTKQFKAIPVRRRH